MSRDTAGLPIWARPEPRGRGPRYSRAQIAGAALAIADEDGIDAVSMRNVATRLGAGTMTLYNYVRTKDELVALMDDALMAEALVPDGELPGDWRAAIATIARRTWGVLLRHPWAVAAGRGAASLGPNTMRHFEQSLAALAGTGLDNTATFDVLALVDSYVFGSVLRASESRRSAGTAREDPEAVGAIVEYGLAQLRTGDYPHTAALLGDRDPRDADAPAPPMDEKGLAEQFERGLQAVLDGAAARFIKHGSPQ